MKNIGNKLASVLLCICLMACFIPGTFAMQVQSSTTHQTIGDMSYTTSTSFSPNGDKTVVVTTEDRTATSVLYAENDTLRVTEENLVTGQIKSISINLSDIKKSVDTLGVSDSIHLRSGDSVSASTFFFGLSYASHPAGAWTIGKDFYTFKNAVESGNNGRNANNLNGFRSCVDQCISSEATLLGAITVDVAALLAASLITAFTGGLGTPAAISIAASILGGTGGAFVCFNSAIASRDNAIIYFDRIV